MQLGRQIENEFTALFPDEKIRKVMSALLITGAILAEALTAYFEVNFFTNHLSTTFTHPAAASDLGRDQVGVYVLPTPDRTGAPTATEVAGTVVPTATATRVIEFTPTPKPIVTPATPAKLENAAGDSRLDLGACAKKQRHTLDCEATATANALCSVGISDITSEDILGPLVAKNSKNPDVGFAGKPDGAYGVMGWGVNLWPTVTDLLNQVLLRGRKVRAVGSKGNALAALEEQIRKGRVVVVLANREMQSNPSHLFWLDENKKPVEVASGEHAFDAFRIEGDYIWLYDPYPGDPDYIKVRKSVFDASWGERTLNRQMLYFEQQP